ncbi:sensor domain-containing diguanylate cyclase [Desulfosporosinus sp. Sb-LF]|uniref:sensor domain-containing diguanylate cyclase n=1 Tax=Desulfosporosinus sp. Sb-LF TaxID=2560027 RepID=UPI00107FBCB7|nr:sensor domain-containing diguanylate cyclase [Desulfosporosinus sp. Sb-LF]TGE31117.1 sensor domain-containing diguanylate cyclase [Desulfosporosinus sp. Sb-LF]
MIIDMKTLILLNFVINIINAGAIAIIWHQYRKRFFGISFWLVNMTLQAVGVALIILRGVAADFISIVLSNTLLLAGSVILLIGMERFTGKKGIQIHNYILLTVYVFLTTYYCLIHPNISMRKIILSAMIVIIDFQTCWLLLRRIAPDLRQVARITGIILGFYVVVSLARMILLVISPLQTSDFFKSGIVDSLSVTLYIMTNVCFTISMILMVNSRLLGEVQAQEEKFTMAFHSSPYAIILTKSSDGAIIEVNDGFVNIFGYQYSEVIGKTLIDLNLLVRGEDRVALVKQLSKGNKVQGAEFQFRKKLGNLMTGLFSANTIMINNEKCILASISDITELSQIKQRLQVMATHDALTGLANRTLLYDRFDIAVANSQRKNKKLAIVSLDLDKFKTINDKLGHDAGDKVLIEAAIRLTGFLRKIDTVARFGGDEFVLLLWDLDHKDDAIKVTQKILNGFQQPFKIGEHKLNLTASIGIAMYPEDGKDIDDLIKKSDESLYYVKNNGRDNYQFYTESISLS